MTKYSFKNDYSEGAHPHILSELQKTNLIQENGYGEDTICEKAKSAIQKYLQNPSSDIHFVSGGTQANLIVISSLLKPYESVIAADTGHIAVHEAGAIEATGHKICTVKTENGKLTPALIQLVLDSHTDEHMVKPKLVFISNSTEVGSVYRKAELESLSTFCKENNLLLYLDGARLGSALEAPDQNLSLKDIAKLTDGFYIGGTKSGALLGEAIVINNESLKENFRFNLKQKGALLAKGRILGIQFLELFKDNLFFELSRHANSMAQKLASSIKDAGHDFLSTPESNQIFPILPNSVIKKLEENFDFYIWQKIDSEKSAIRLVTSWATEEKAVESFINLIKKV